MLCLRLAGAISDSAESGTNGLPVSTGSSGAGGASDMINAASDILVASFSDPMVLALVLALLGGASAPRLLRGDTGSCAAAGEIAGGSCDGGDPGDGLIAGDSGAGGAGGAGGGARFLMGEFGSPPVATAVVVSCCCDSLVASVGAGGGGSGGPAAASASAAGGGGGPAATAAAGGGGGGGADMFTSSRKQGWTPKPVPTKGADVSDKLAVKFAVGLEQALEP